MFFANRKRKCYICRVKNAKLILFKEGVQNIISTNFSLCALLKITQINKYLHYESIKQAFCS